VKLNLPKKGHVGILHVTDKQFAQMEIFFGKKIIDTPAGPQQLELF
jgi:CRISPR-associated protein Cas2